MMESAFSQAGLSIIGLAGLFCAVLDLCCAMALNWVRGFNPKRTLQAIASGLLGPTAFGVGIGSAALGLGLHFFIALFAAGAYFFLSGEVTFMLWHPVAAGILYGAGVHLFMSFVVLPLSRLRRPFSTVFFISQLIIHMTVVGPSIALTFHHFRRDEVQALRGLRF